MNEVLASFDVQQGTDAAMADAGFAEDFPVLRGLRMPKPGRNPRAPWKSDLSPADLQCLLQVIEGELIPQLLREYSPARCSPHDPA